MPTARINSRRTLCTNSCVSLSRKNIMATAAPYYFQQPSTDQKVSLDHTANMSLSENPPPSYYSKDHNIPIITTPQLVGMHLNQPTNQPTAAGTSVVVTQPVVTVQEPATTCSLVCAVLSSIFCCFICGLTGIFIAWKARLYVLENKFEQARHSVSIVWIFFGLAIFFGLITWGLFTFFVILPFHDALAKEYNDYD